MRICQVDWRPFQLPLLPETGLSDRKGYILVLRDEEGNEGLGECAPLHEWGGVHSEGLVDVDQAFHKVLSPFLQQRELNLNYMNEEQMGFGLFAFDQSQQSEKLKIALGQLPVSLQFAYEQALWHLLWKRNPSAPPFFSSYSSSLSPSISIDFFNVNICGLVLPYQFHENQLDKIAQFINEKKYRAVKIKIGRSQLGLAHEVKMLRKLAFLTKNRVRFRLDGNGQLKQEDLFYLAENLAEFPLDYVEGALPTWSDYRALAMAKNLKILPPLALDELLREYPVDQVFAQLESLSPLQISTLILKPTAYPGLHSLFRIMKLAQQKNLQVIISSTFDSPLTLVTLAYLSQKRGKNLNPQGLGTLDFFQREKVSEVFPFFWPQVEGALHLPSFPPQ